MTENQRRWRGYHLLETLCAHLRNELRWGNLTQPTHAKPTRGMYDPQHDWYDQTAGPKDHIPGPRITILDINPLPEIAYPGESITLTPLWLEQRRDDLHRADLMHAVREYARGDATYKVAYHPSRNAIRWHRDAPRALWDACRLLADVEPMNPNTIRKYQRSQSGAKDLTSEKREEARPAQPIAHLEAVC